MILKEREKLGITLNHKENTELFTLLAEKDVLNIDGFLLKWQSE